MIKFLKNYILLALLLLSNILYSQESTSSPYAQLKQALDASKDKLIELQTLLRHYTNRNE